MKRNRFKVLMIVATLLYPVAIGSVASVLYYGTIEGEELFPSGDYYIAGEWVTPTDVFNTALSQSFRTSTVGYGITLVILFVLYFATKPNIVHVQ